MRQVQGPDEREETLKEMMEAYQQSLLRMCCVYLGDYALAEDAVQETFIKAYRHLNDFRGDCSAKSWLTRIAINTCKDVRRSSWFKRVDRAAPMENVPAPDCLPSPEQMDLVAAISALPRRDMELVLLTCYQGFTAAEAAQATGMNRRTVAARLQRAKAKLRIELEGGLRHE